MPGLLDVEALQAEILSARDLLQRGRPAAALTRFRALEARIARSADRRPELAASHARLLLGMAAATFDVTGDLPRAIDLVEQSRRLALESGAEELTPSVYGQLGLLLLRQGETGLALKALNDGVRLSDKAPPYDRMTLLLNRGAVSLDRGDADQAAQDFERCAALARQEGEPVLAWKATHNLGYAEFLSGRLPRALAALEAAERLNPGEVSPIALLDRARVLREAGLVRDAEVILGRAAEGFRVAKLPQDLAETELARAECALVEGDVRSARSLAASAHRRFARRGNVRWQRRAELMLLRCERLSVESRSARSRRATFAALADRATELAEACRSEGRTDLARRAELLGCECRLLAGAPAGNIPRLSSRDSLQTRLQRREVRALNARAAGDLTRGLREVRKGLEELGSYQHSFGSLDLRTASAVHGTTLTKVGLDLALRSGSATTVMELVEHARAVSTRLPQVRPPSDARTAELLEELRQVEEEARTLEGDPAGTGDLEHLRDRAARLQRDIRARAWEIEGEEGVAARPPTAAQVGAAAGAAGKCFVSYARHQGRWVAVTLSGRRRGLHDLADVAEVAALVHRVRADLDALAMPALPPPLRDAVRRSLDLGLGRLDGLLVAPLRITGRPVVLSCSGDLLFLPWGLLPGRVGVATLVTPSAATWLRAKGAARPPAPRVLAVAGPDLGRAGEEVGLVAAAWPGGVAVTGSDATTERAHEGLVKADVMHVAAHGRHRQDSPLFSSVRLADGHLYAYEIDPGEGLADCVVLSACDAGLATVRPGDESLGLAHVLLQLGARSVIAGVARVRDEACAPLMRELHEAVAAGSDSASALAAVQAHSLEEPSPVGFVSFGASW